tara:strand:- start:892 stop:1422 length:531 start_codon:yes stop_codon:yes gene_type:complete
MKEIYKDIIGYEELYKVSNLGNVKSIDKYISRSDGLIYFRKGRVLSPGVNAAGYLIVGLSKESKQKSRYIHQLVAESFFNHKPCGYKLVINHLDFNKSNNLVTNLEVVTNRVNSNHKHIKSSSIYTGVSYRKKQSKWSSSIYFNSKSVFLGLFDDEYDAHLAYQDKLKSIIAYETV